MSTPTPEAIANALALRMGTIATTFVIYAQFIIWLLVAIAFNWVVAIWIIGGLSTAFTILQYFSWAKGTKQ